MKVLALYVVGVLMLGCGSSGSSSSGSVSHCKTVNAAICSKVFTCDEAASFRSGYGTSQANCASDMDAFCNASGGCPAGMTFHADMAAQCVSATQAVTCAQIGSGGEAALFPAACDAVCS
jgi:hypothetical protein